ncbi:MAG TPA: lamin tail domain-containing protein, partial [Verrucomicrobiae bacterium]
RYRWNWRPRVTPDPDNWFNFTNLVVAASSANVPNFVERLKLWMDIPNFLRPIITHHVCSSWDSYAYSRGKNMYAYKPDHQGWRLLLWDIELSLGSSGNSPSDSIYTMFDQTLLSIILNHPEIHREYLRGFKEAVDGPLAPGVADVALNERYAAFQSEAIGVDSPTSIKNFIAARRSYLQSILPNVTFAVSTPSSQTVSSSNTLVLSGVAPLDLESIQVNGIAYPVIWTGITTWQILVPLASGGNLLNVAAFDRFGNPISNGTATRTANYTGAPVAPEGKIVFNELMCRAEVPGAEFVELFNTDSNVTFDLSGWRVNGLDYTFPSGATIAPRSYLVLAADPITYNLTYGAANLAFGQYAGSLDPNGETLTLLRPGANPGEEVVVNRVRYEAVAPWPIVTNGVSLQLVDAAEDNSRVANWAVSNNSLAEPPPANLALMAFNSSWRYNQTANLDGVNWMATSYNHGSWPFGSGILAYENNSAIVPLIGTTLADPRAGNGSVQSGHAYYFRTTFSLAYPPEFYQFTARARVDDGAIFYVNGVEVQRIRMPAGAASNSSLASDLPGNGDTLVDDVFTIPSSAFTTGLNVIAVEVHQINTSSTDIVFGMKLDAAFVDAGPLLATQGRANNVVTNLPAFPPLWLNELQAVNVTGPLDNFGQRDPWIELFNSATTNFNLAGYYLSDNYTNLTQWAFPSGMTASANGFTQVWCDNQTGQTAGNAVHTSFALSPGSGRLALSRLVNGHPQIVDYLTYTNLSANWSYGDVPDGQPFYRNAMFYVTPGATNNGASAPIQVYINEWMADNSATLMDSADNQYEDWFELFNPGTNAIDLGGYYLTDNLLDPFKFQIPNNGQYVIPAGGYLLAWADNESEQNNAGSSDLHVDFALGKGGEAIGLFAADGTSIDAITFGAQTTDISEGRFPNGAGNIYAMPMPTPRTANVIPNLGPAPSMAGVAVSGNSFVSQWNVTAGQTVVLEFCDDLSVGEWTQIGAEVTGTGGAISFTNHVDEAPLRFFRLKVVSP